MPFQLYTEEFPDDIAERLKIFDSLKDVFYDICDDYLMVYHQIQLSDEEYENFSPEIYREKVLIATVNICGFIYAESKFGDSAIINNIIDYLGIEEVDKAIIDKLPQQLMFNLSEALPLSKPKLKGKLEVVKVEAKDCGGIGITLRDKFGGEFKAIIFDEDNLISIGMGYEIEGEIRDNKQIYVSKIQD